MCGIVGFVDKTNKLKETDKQALVERMVERISHRGGDDKGTYSTNGVAIGHARLSILDLSKNGAQPFFNRDKTIVLSYNGEIYNYQAVNRTLKEKNYPLQSNCDTETLLYAFIDEGDGCLTKLNGMFAFSIYDAKASAITLAVDRFSIKPLYYIDTPEWFAWSSEVKSLLLLTGFRAELNESKLSEYFLFRQVSGEETLFKHIHRLLPAQVLTYKITSDTVEKHIYWRLEKKNFGIIDFEKVLLEKLDRSVSEHLLADVPVGVQLSGGVDSSLVTALASRYKKDLNTFSIGLKDESWNEFRYSRVVAEKYHTIHHELIFSEDDFVRALPGLTYFQDEPISHSHSVPMYLLAKEAREYVKVLLSGEGADEVFFGYQRYQRLFGRGARPDDIILSNAFGKSDLIKKISASPYDEAEVIRQRRSILDPFSGLAWVDQVSYYDVQTYLPSLLLRQDKMGMAATLENRVPFLDYTLVEFGFSLPERLKINTEENKILLKRVTEKYIPRELIYRRKCGFGQPIAAWLRNPKGLGVLLDMLIKYPRRSFLNYAAIHELITEHRNKSADYTEMLWTLINLELWLRIFIDGIKPEEIIEEIYD